MASHWSILPSFLVESNVTTGRWTLNLPRRKGEINEESLSFVYRMACYFATLQFDNVLVYNYQEGHCPWKLRFVSWVSERGPAAMWQMWLYCQEIRQHIITDVSGTPRLCIPRNMSVWQGNELSLPWFIRTLFVRLLWTQLCLFNHSRICYFNQQVLSS